MRIDQSLQAHRPSFLFFLLACMWYVVERSRASEQASKKDISVEIPFYYLRIFAVASPKIHTLCTCVLVLQQIASIHTQLIHTGR